MTALHYWKNMNIYYSLHMPYIVHDILQVFVTPSHNNISDNQAEDADVIGQTFIRKAYKEVSILTFCLCLSPLLSHNRPSIKCCYSLFLYIHLNSHSFTRRFWYLPWLKTFNKISEWNADNGNDAQSLSMNYQYIYRAYLLWKFTVMYISCIDQSNIFLQ
jgi:hypothetical protein